MDVNSRPAADATPLALVVGRNAKRLRGPVSGDRLATAARRYGLANWGTSRVAELESGRVSPTVPTLVALAAALGEIRGGPITLADLLHSDQPIKLNDALTVDSATLARFLSDPIAFRAGPRESVAAVLSRIAEGSSEAEQRAANAIGISAARLHSTAAKLWNRPFEDERDGRAGPDASAQKRGRVTRQLYDELRAATHGHDQ